MRYRPLQRGMEKRQVGIADITRFKSFPLSTFACKSPQVTPYTVVDRYSVKLASYMELARREDFSPRLIFASAVRPHNCTPPKFTTAKHQPSLQLPFRNATHPQSIWQMHLVVEPQPAELVVVLARAAIEVETEGAAADVVDPVVEQIRTKRRNGSR